MRNFLIVVSSIVCAAFFILFWIVEDNNKVFLFGFILFAIIILALFVFDNSSGKVDISTKSLLRHVKRIGGNFAFIAENVAMIIYIIDNSIYNRSFALEQKMFAATYIDLISYIANGTATEEDCKQIVSRAIETAYYDRTSDYPHYLVYCLCFEIEKYIFQNDFGRIFYDAEIENSINSKSKQIKRRISITLRKGMNCKIYPLTREIVLNCLKDEDIYKTIKESFN